MRLSGVSDMALDGSVMPVMSTLGMMFALLHNCGTNTATLLWWEDAF